MGTVTEQAVMVLDNTRRNTFETCPKKYYWEFKLDLRTSRGSSPLRFGSCVHDGLEAYYEYVMEHDWEPREPAVQAGVLAINDCWERESKGFEYVDDFRSRDTAIETLQTYITHYEDESGYMKILAPEIPFKVSVPMDGRWKYLPDGELEGFELYYMGRVDALVYYSNQVWLLEHKTTSALAQSQRYLHRSAQTIGYNWAVNRILQANPHLTDGRVLTGSMINMIETASSKKRDGTYGNIRRSFAREPQLYTEDDFENWLDSLVYSVGKMLDEAKGFPMNLGSCYNYNTTCPYAMLCEQPRDNPRTPEELGYIEHHWNPLAGRKKVWTDTPE